MANKSFQALISGNVQGVGFRYFAVHVAQRLGINGNVRNVASGDVEVNAHGDESNLNEFLKELHVGPSSAEVRDVRVAWSDENGAEDSENGFHAVS
jgi:acylphosphatase